MTKRHRIPCRKPSRSGAARVDRVRPYVVSHYRMQSPRDRLLIASRWARYTATVVVIIAGGLALAVSALAAKPEVRIGAHDWMIKVSGRSYTVTPGGRIVYPACATVEMLTPVVKLTARRGPEHSYAAWLVGPKSAGESQGREKVFDGTSGVFDDPFIAIAFPKLTRKVNKTHFVAGTYRLEMMFGGKRAKPKLVETVTLVTKAGC